MKTSQEITTELLLYIETLAKRKHYKALHGDQHAYSVMNSIHRDLSRMVLLKPKSVPKPTAKRKPLEQLSLSF